MVSWRRRTAYYLAGFFGVLSVYVAAYHWGMIVFEGASPTVHHSLQIVVETFTTTGYGSDAPWTSPEMNVFVSIMDLTGVLFFFLSLPLFIVPAVQKALSTDPPTSVDLEDHVVLCGFSGRGAAFVDELEAWDADHVVVEPDAERAAELHEDDVPVVQGDYATAAGLEAASAGDARAIVADADDETNASVALTAREVAGSATVVGFAEDPDNAEYIRYAGADVVLTPRHLLGESLAAKATSALSTELDDVVELDDAFDVAELPVGVDSEVAGLQLGESRIRERTGADIIGLWRDGEFDPSPGPEDVLEPGVILLVAGRKNQLERLKEFTQAGARSHGSGRVVVVGYGEVGRTVTSRLAADGVPYTVVDVEEGPAVDVVGDARDEETLRAAEVTDARGVILAIPGDTTAIFTTLVLRELEEDVGVTVRAEDPDNVRKLYLAGADYVLSLATVSGRMLADEVLDEAVMTPDRQVDVIRCGAPELTGRTLAEADVRSRTGATVVAVERDGELLTDLDASFEFVDGDELVVAGSDAAVNAFNALARE